MIKKAFLVAGLAFALYTLFITHIKPHWSISQHKRRQNNQIRAEKYLYANHQAHSVLVGSSLSSNITQLPGVYNLALGGQSPLDGLAIIIQGHRPLRTVLVEMNFIDREEDTDFTELITHPVLMPAKQVFMSLRADKQPLAVVGEQVQNILDKVFSRLTYPISSPTVTRKAIASDVFAKQLSRYAQIPDSALFEQKFGELKQAVALLEQRGIQVVFYEMPVDCRLCNTPKAVAIRAAFRRHFSPDTYAYLALPACAGYSTTDGLHLDGPSATKYTQFLQQQMARL